MDHWGKVLGRHTVGSDPLGSGPLGPRPELRVSRLHDTKDGRTGAHSTWETDIQTIRHSF